MITNVISTNKEMKQNIKTNANIYIANQITPEGIDEIQRLILAHSLGMHVALAGPPGVGKTKSVYEIAKILGLPLHLKSCSGRTVESHIISYPVLMEKNGISITEHVNGPLCMAMLDGGIFYGDEFNLLRSDVQKRLNSAFDDRRAVDRNDGVQITAAPGFWAVISYNPTENMVSRDLEDSVADRFIHFYYGRWTSDFKAYVSSRTAMGKNNPKQDTAQEFNLIISWRAITPEGEFISGKIESGKFIWRNYFTGELWNGKPRYIYRVCGNDRFANASSTAGQTYSPNAFARLISRFTEIIYSLAATGKSPLLAENGMKNIIAPEDLELLSVHESSTRIESAALSHYNELIRRGSNAVIAQTYSARLVIDQICYGQFRDRKLTSLTVHELVTAIARCLGLLGERTQYNTTTEMAPKKLAAARGNKI